MLLKKCKRAFALLLAGVLTVSSVGLPSVTTEAAGTEEQESQTRILLTNELKDVSFDGTNTYSLSEADVAKLKKVQQSLEISITFKVTSASGQYINLLEIFDSSNNSSSSTTQDESSMALIVSTTGQVFWMSGGYQFGTNWNPNSGQAINDSKYHTLTLSVSPSGMKCKMDGRAMASSGTNTDRNTAAFVTAFFGGTASGNFTDWRANIDSAVVGGLSAGSYFTADTFHNLEGEIKSVLITDGGYDESAFAANHLAGSEAAMAELTALLGTAGEETDYSESRWNAYTSSAAYTTAVGLTASNAPYEIYNAQVELKEAIEMLTGELNLDTIGKGISAMFNTDPDNTWLFAGGVETQGRFSEIRGARNYVGQFEEYIRWTKATANELLRQRYMINVGKAGQDIVTFETKLDSYIESLKPKAVAYMIGKEDYSKGDDGIEAFKTALASVINKALAMKENGGYVVIQLPHAVNDAAATANIEKYIAAAEEVIKAVDEAKLTRVVLMDHYTKTNNETFKSTKLTADGLLNADGHYEIAKQLATKTEGMTATFPTLSKWTEETAPSEYIDKAPTVTAAAGSLSVTIPEGVEGENWKYTVTVNGAQISGTATDATFTITDLPADEAYELSVQSADGKKQLNSVYGTIAADAQGGSAQLTELQQAVVDKVNGDDSLTWLFMGDSITHAALWTNGYDGIAQVMEKYVREDLGRADDVFINTGNSSATTTSTIANIEQRLTKYTPDIVVIMIGTNDTLSNESYKANLKTIVGKIKETNPDALIVFRSPTPANSGNYNSKIEGGYLDAMKSVASENGIICVDQYTDWKQEFDTYSYLWGGNYYFGSKTTANTLHPGAAGQLRVAQQLIEACGLNTNTEIANLSYRFDYAEESSDIVPGYSATEHSIGINKSSLEAAYGSSIGEITVVLTDTAANRTYTKKSGLDNTAVTIGDLPYATYKVNVIANMAGGVAKHVNFKEQEITLTEGMDPIFQLLFNGNANLTDAAEGTAVGTLGVDVDSDDVFTYELVAGDGSTDNAKFEIDGTTLKIKTTLDAWASYSVRVKATSGGSSVEKVLPFRTMPTLRAVRTAAQADFEQDKSSLDVDLSEVTFDGNTSINLADSADSKAARYYDGGAYLQALSKLQSSKEGGTIIFRFSTTQNGIIFGVGSSNADDGTNMIFGTSGGSVRSYFRIASGSGLKGNLGSGLNDGNVHTVAIGFQPKSSRVLMSIDGSANLVPNLAAWQVASWFSVNNSAITKFEIGGGGYSSIYNLGNFNGSIDFVTITDDIFTEAELQAISGGIKISGLQELSYSDNVVTVPEGARYTATELTWNDEKTSGTFTLNVKDDEEASFKDVQIDVKNAGENGYIVETSNATSSSITVTLRKYQVLLSSSAVTELQADAAVGTLSVENAAPEGEYTYTLVDGNGSTDNAKFKIETVNGTATLKTAEALELRQTYSIRVKAESGENSTETVFELKTMPTLKSVRAAAQADFAADKTALDIDVSGVLFDGNTSVNLADSSSEYYNDGAYMEVLNKLRTESTGGTIIFRFKAKSNGTILGIGSEPGDNGKSMAFALADGNRKTGAMRALFPIESGDARLKTYVGNSYADTAVHTVAMSFDTSKADYQNEVLISIDGSDHFNTDYPAAWWTEEFRTWLNKLKTDITNFEIGGGSYSNQIVSGVGGFNGSIDFVTITDEVFTEEELKVISSDREEIAAPPTGISEATATVSIDNTVVVPEDANYTASAVTWNDDKTSGSFTLTAKDGYSFSNAVITVNNASGYTVTASSVSGDTITVTLTKIQKSVAITNASISALTAGTEIGTLSVDGAEADETFTYTLAAGTGDNDKFEIDGTTLKVKTALEKGMTYNVTVTATSGDSETVNTTLALRTIPTLKSARDEAAAAFEADQTGLDVDVSDVNFNGSTSVNLATLNDGAYLAVAEKLRTDSTGGTIIFRFKTNAKGTILGIGSDPGDNGKSLAFGMADYKSGSTVTTANALRALFPIASGASNLKGIFEGGGNLADGQVHTIAMSFDTAKADYQNQVLISVDGGNNCYVEAWWTEAFRTWLNMLKTPITSFELGGGSYSNKVESSVGGFNGEIDFLTITDTVYNEEELKSISGDTTTVPRTTKVTSAQVTLSQDLASVTTGAETYTGTVTWDDAKENGTITLTAAENVKFDGTTVSVTNAAALGYTAGTATVTESTITIPLTKNEEPPQPQITTVSGEQTLTISGNTVTVAEGAGYTASALTWNEEGTSGEFTLTANENVEFASDVTVTIANADELSLTSVTFTVTTGSVKVTLTKEKPAPSETAEQKNLKEELTNLAAELGKESAYTAASFKQFKDAYEAAQKAISDGETDAATLMQLLNSLKQAHAGLAANKPDPTPVNPDPTPVNPTPVNPAPVVEEGKTYDAGNYRYKVLSTTEMTAEVVGLKNTKLTKITINNSVNLGGKNYTVISVGANAFKGNKKITSVVMKKNIQTIGKNAFAGCTKLKKATINSKKLTTINAKVFSGCKSLKQIVIKSKVLKKVGKNAFKGINKKAVIKVPSAKLKAYTKLLAKKGQSKSVKIRK